MTHLANGDIHDKTCQGNKVRRLSCLALPSVTHFCYSVVLLPIKLSFFVV